MYAIDPAELSKAIKNLIQSGYYGPLTVKLRRDTELTIGFRGGEIVGILVEPGQVFDTERKPTP